jgi:hypothetical protein
VEHLARHGVKPEEAEDVVMAARQPYSLERPDDKWLVWGRTSGVRSSTHRQHGELSPTQV